MTTDLELAAKDRGIKYYLVSYTDLFGVQRAKLVPAPAIGEAQRSGVPFGGFAAWLAMSPAELDILAKPDASTLIQLPWKPEVAWVAADLWRRDGKPLEQAPRNVFRRVMGEAEVLGYEMKSGVECEFFLIKPDGTAIWDAADHQARACYDQQSMMRAYDVIAEVCDAIQALGWKPYQNHHEDAHGQFEMNWQYDTAMVTADRHTFFKFMLKSVAEKHGLRATFMPKPFATAIPTGCHAHVSLWRRGENIFLDESGELGLSSLAYQFLGGILAHAESFAAITNPTVNSYKRINPPVLPNGVPAGLGANAITYGGNNRTHLLRIPAPGRLEVRISDGAANPYLLQAAYLAAGLDGIATKADPGKRLDIHMFEDAHTLTDVRRLPTNLLDAVRHLDKSAVLRAKLGAEFVDAYVKLRTMDWNTHCAHLSEWERSATLDC
jgi:glutamine synthetase